MKVLCFAFIHYDLKHSPTNHNVSNNLVITKKRHKIMRERGALPFYSLSINSSAVVPNVGNLVLLMIEFDYN